MGKRSDGCTLAPDLNFKECCKEHDALYQVQYGTRSSADRILRMCIRKAGWPKLAWIYWLAVRIFGWIAWRRHKKNMEQG